MIICHSDVECIFAWDPILPDLNFGLYSTKSFAGNFGLSYEEKFVEPDPIFKTESNICPSRCVLHETTQVLHHERASQRSLPVTKLEHGIISCIGNTPLVRLNKVIEADFCL